MIEIGYSRGGVGWRLTNIFRPTSEQTLNRTSSPRLPGYTQSNCLRVPDEQLVDEVD